MQLSSPSSPGDDRPANDPSTLVIANEFAEVMVQRVETGNGTRLEIRSSRLGRAVQLDAVALEALTWAEPSVFSELLADPFGPSPEVSSDPAGAEGQ